MRVAQELYEWVWDCKSCKTTKILGRHESCQNCGMPRPKGDIFYDPGVEQVVTDPKLIAKASAGPDWICQHCEGSNSDLRESCKGCSAPRGSSPERNVIDYALGHEPMSDPTADKPRSYERGEWKKQPKPANESPTAAPRSSRDAGHKPAYVGRPAGAGVAGSDFAEFVKTPFGMLAGVFFILLGFLLYGVLKTNTEEVKLVRCDWARTITVERFKTVRESDWSVPHGGRVVSSALRIHHYRDVFSHNETRYHTRTERYQSGTERYRSGTRSKGNGFAEAVYSTRPVYSTRTVREPYTHAVYRKEPVYDRYYEYDIERWKFEREVRAAASDQKPLWPDPQLREKERENGRTEVYQAHFTDNRQKIHTLTLPEARWKHLEVGGTYKAEINYFRTLVKLTENNV